jgi:hypothetical protein
VEDKLNIKIFFYFFCKAKYVLENEKSLQEDVNSDSMYLVGNISKE